MVDRFYGTLYVSNSEMHSDTDWVRASDYDALEAEWMAMSQDDGKVERALESAQARIRDLEAALTDSIERHRVNADWKAKHHELEAERDALVGALDYELAYNNAKARIHELEAQIERLRNALEFIASYEASAKKADSNGYANMSLAIKLCERAMTALADTQPTQPETDK